MPRNIVSGLGTWLFGMAFKWFFKWVLMSSIQSPPDINDSSLSKCAVKRIISVYGYTKIRLVNDDSNFDLVIDDMLIILLH